MNQPMIRRCPLRCGNDYETTDIHLPEGPLRRCPTCNQLFSTCDEATYQASMQEFDDEAGTFVPEKSRHRQRKRIQRILRQGQSRLPDDTIMPALLDVGCSSGSVLRIASDLGYHVYGVEPAPKAATTAISHGFQVFNGLLEDAAFPNNHFDMVTLFEVIEHLADPITLAREIHRILKPGGVWLIGTGNAHSWTVTAEKQNWEYFDISRHGGHISFFTPKSMKRLADESGFSLALVDTRRVRLAERHQVGALTYRTLKIVAELLDYPARILNKGHDLQAVLIRQ